MSATRLSRERIAELRAWAETRMVEGVADHCDGVAAWWGDLLALLDAYEAQRPRPAQLCPCCAERDRLAAENAELRRERDEARAKVAEVRRAWDATVETRDEARAEVERLRAQIAAARAALEGRDV